MCTPFVNTERGVYDGENGFYFNINNNGLKTYVARN